MRYAALHLTRHDSVVKRLKIATANKFDLITENQVIGSGDQRPDPVIKRESDGKVFIIEVTVPFDNRIAVFKDAAETRSNRYLALRDEHSAQQPAEIITFIVGALGAWDPANDLLLSKICSRSYAHLMRKLCVSEVISYSRDIYIEHLTGTRQR